VKNKNVKVNNIGAAIEKFIIRFMEAFLLAGSLYSAYKIRLFAVMSYG
jgi:hypothetical protein